MNKCLYTNKECKSAKIDGECAIGYQNCGWENWKQTDDIDELDLFDMLDEEEE